MKQYIAPEIMTPDQVAAFLQINKDTVYELIRGRKLAATRIGRNYRIPRADLDLFLSSYSTRSQVREAHFKRVYAIGDRNQGLSEKRVLNELKKLDQRRSSSIAYP